MSSELSRPTTLRETSATEEGVLFVFHQDGLSLSGLHNNKMVGLFAWTKAIALTYVFMVVKLQAAPATPEDRPPSNPTLAWYEPGYSTSYQACYDSPSHIGNYSAHGYEQPSDKDTRMTQNYTAPSIYETPNRLVPSTIGIEDNLGRAHQAVDSPDKDKPSWWKTNKTPSSVADVSRRRVVGLLNSLNIPWNLCLNLSLSSS